MFKWMKRFFIKDVKDVCKQSLSIDENRISVLMFLLIVTTLFALFSLYSTGDITNNLLFLVQTLIGAVVGVNGVKEITEAYEDRTKMLKGHTNLNEQVTNSNNNDNKKNQSSI